MPVILIDAGPLTALLNRREEHHTWATGLLREFEQPLLTSEAVLAEAAYLITRRRGDADGLFDLRARGVIEVGIRFDEEWESLRRLMARYRNVPMSLADATLVRLSELHRDCRVWTLDSDFRIYRRHGNKAIPLLMPED
jgi:predicted nucleic acid-binding protein